MLGMCRQRERAEQEEAHALSVHEPGNMHQGKETVGAECGDPLLNTPADAGYQRRGEEGGANLVNPIRMISLFLKAMGWGWELFILPAVPDCLLLSFFAAPKPCPFLFWVYSIEVFETKCKILLVFS